MKNRITLLVFMVAYVLLSYLDKNLLGEVRCYENFVLALIIAGIAYLIHLLTSLDEKP